MLLNKESSSSIKDTRLRSKATALMVMGFFLFSLSRIMEMVLVSELNTFRITSGCEDMCSIMTHGCGTVCLNAYF